MMVVRILITSILLLVGSLSVTYILNKFDKEMNIEIRKMDIISTAIISILSSLPITVSTSGISIEYITITVVTMMILSMTITDRQTKQVYVILNIVCLIAGLILLISNFEFVKYGIVNLSQYKALIACLVILAALFITQGIGLGDSLLYLAILMIYLSISHYGSLMLILNILFSNILFLIKNSKIFIKDKTEKRPLIPDILIAWVIFLYII